MYKLPKLNIIDLEKSSSIIRGNRLVLKLNEPEMTIYDVSNKGAYDYDPEKPDYMLYLGELALNINDIDESELVESVKFLNSRNTQNATQYSKYHMYMDKFFMQLLYKLGTLCAKSDSNVHMIVAQLPDYFLSTEKFADTINSMMSGFRDFYNEKNSIIAGDYLKYKTSLAKKRFDVMLGTLCERAKSHADFREPFQNMIYEIKNILEKYVYLNDIDSYKER